MQQLLTVGEGGYLELDMEGLPEGFFNPYAGQYNLVFVYPANNQLIEFTAMDGQTYDSICLTLQVSYNNLESVTMTINPITNDIP